MALILKVVDTGSMKGFLRIPNCGPTLRDHRIYVGSLCLVGEVGKCSVTTKIYDL